MSLSPFAYNHSYAQRYFPLNKEKAEAENLRWHEASEQRNSSPPKTEHEQGQFPSTDDSFVTSSVVSGRQILISTPEIKLSRRLGIPLACETYEERMERRAKRLGEISLQERVCDRTGTKVRTAYSDSTTPIVWDKGIYEREFSS